MPSQRTLEHQERTLLEVFCKSKNMRDIKKFFVISFVHLKLLCRFANFGGCRSEIGLATPNLVLRLKLGMPFLLLNNEITVCLQTFVKVN